jgi:serine/threonine protein kinase
LFFYKRHKHFVQIYGYSVAPEILVVKDYPLGNLNDFIFEGKLDKCLDPLKQKLMFMKDIACALNALHINGFIHNDVMVKNY